MNNKKKFDNFLESLKGNDQDKLIESIEKGFQVCFESKNFNMKSVMNKASKLSKKDVQKADAEKKTKQLLDEEKKEIGEMKKKLSAEDFDKWLYNYD